MPCGVVFRRTSMPPSSTGLRFRRAWVTPRSAAIWIIVAVVSGTRGERHEALQAGRRVFSGTGGATTGVTTGVVLATGAGACSAGLVAAGAASGDRGRRRLVLRLAAGVGLLLGVGRVRQREGGGVRLRRGGHVGGRRGLRLRRGRRRQRVGRRRREAGEQRQRDAAVAGRRGRRRGGLLGVGAAVAAAWASVGGCGWVAAFGSWAAKRAGPACPGAAAAPAAAAAAAGASPGMPCSVGGGRGSAAGAVGSGLASWSANSSRRDERGPAWACRRPRARPWGRRPWCRRRPSAWRRPWDGSAGRRSLRSRAIVAATVVAAAAGWR